MSNGTSIPDPNVQIPDAVRAAAEAAQALHGELYTPEATDTQNHGTQSHDEIDATDLTPRGNDIPKPHPVSSAEEQSWEHRYKSMKGRYDASQSQIRGLAEQVSSLQRLIATMEAAPRPQAQPDGTADHVRLLTDEEENDYGSDFLNVVGKKATEVLSPEVKSLRAEVQRLKSQMDGVGNYVAQDAESRMTSYLDNSVEGWRDQNTSSDFLNWLQLPDPYSGAIRHELLKAAWERRDAPRVAAFFRGFISDEAVVSPARRGPDQTNQVDKIPLESLAAPGRAKTAAANGAPAEKPIITSAQISRFYADAAAGRYRGRDAEKDAMEKQIFEAQREGRIR